VKRPKGTHPIYWRSFPYSPPSDWKNFALSELADKTKGKLASDLTSKASEGARPYLLTGHLNGDEAPQFTVSEDIPDVAATDTVMAVDGTVGKVFTGLEGALGSTMMRFRPKNINDSDFLFYLLQSLEAYTSATAIIGAVPHLDKRLLSQLVLKIPDQPERTLIGKILRAIDEMLSATNAELLAAQRLKTALMQQLFTKGIPGRHMNFKKIKRGLMPASWQMTTIGRISDVGSGVTLNQDRLPRSNGYRYLTVVNVQRDYIDLTEERYLELLPSEVPSRLLKKNDILVVEGHANSSEIGRAAMVDERTEGMTFQNHLFRVRANTDEVIPSFLLYSLNCERVRRHWNAICNTSSGLNTINRRQLRRLEIPKPTRPEQEEIVTFIEASKATIRSCEGKLNALTTLKKSLLQNLLTGKVRVNMEAQV